jgi:hypothetical protein
MSEELRNLYEQTLIQFLTENQIKSVWFIRGDFEKVIYSIEMEDGVMKVQKKGWKTPFNHLYFDFSVDYANLLAVVEREFFLHIRNSQTEEAQAIFTR